MAYRVIWRISAVPMNSEALDSSIVAKSLTTRSSTVNYLLNTVGAQDSAIRYEKFQILLPREDYLDSCLYLTWTPMICQQEFVAMEVCLSLRGELSRFIRITIS